MDSKKENDWIEIKTILHLGQIVCGSIIFKTHFGIFLDLEPRGVGLVLLPYFHNNSQIAEQIWEQVQVGDLFCGVIINFDDSARKVNISRLAEDFNAFGKEPIELGGSYVGIPQIASWEEILANLKVGDSVIAKVLAKRDYGVFVDFEKKGVQSRINGLITSQHLSDSSIESNKVMASLGLGQEVKAVVLSVSPYGRALLSLSESDCG
jgi:ribosomal protein S1